MFVSGSKEYEQRKELLYKFIEGLNKKYLKSEDDFNKAFRDLADIYLDNKTQERAYKHMVSDVYLALMRIRPNQNDIQNFEMVTSNMHDIREKYSSIESKNLDLLYSIDKLTDHVQLEILRLNYLFLQFYEPKYKDKIKYDAESYFDIQNKFSERMDEQDERYNVLYKEYKSTKREISKLKIEYVTILGIFCSLILRLLGL